MRRRFGFSDPAVRRSMLSLMVVLVLAFAPVACGSGDDDVAVADDLIEQYVAAWNGTDGGAIAALFTEDGIFIGEGVHEFRSLGREEIRVDARPGAITEVESTGPVTMADDGTFRCPIKFRALSYDMVAEMEFEVEDGLISRLVQRDEFADDVD